MLYLQSEDAAKSENVILGVRACLKNHSRNLHAPLCGIFHPNSVAVAHYGALIRAKYPTNCDAHLAESLFQTRSSSVATWVYVQKYAKNSTWLLHEAFCLFSQADKFKPYEKHHSTVKDACELAQKLEAENLILYHTEDKNISRRKELYTEEGRQYYKGNLWIPDDLETYKL